MRIITRLALSLSLMGMTFGLTACAVESIPYPKLSTAKKLKDKILSREQQDEVIRDLTAEQKAHQNTAISEIEKPQ